MRTPPKAMQPQKSNIRKTEKAIEAAKKAKLKEAALMEKYKKQAEKETERAQKEQERAFRHVAAEAVAPTEERANMAPKKRGISLSTALGIFFLLIAVVMILWQFRFFDRFFQKPASTPSAAVSTIEEASAADDSLVP